jgi:methylmalonyl-CoA mutase
LSKLLSAPKTVSFPSTLDPRASPLVLGITGPGGAGKTTLIDELTLRFLKSRPKARLAILSHDPGFAGGGALLADRATMIYAQDDRVFMRSLATHSDSAGLSKATRRSVQVLKSAGFDLIIIESAGIGQDNLPFANGLVDRQILVLSPDYGSRLQLQKLSMLEVADIVVVNKTDLPGSRTALSELEQRLSVNNKRPQLIATTAKRHGDPGVDRLFAQLVESAL